MTRVVSESRCNRAQVAFEMVPSHGGKVCKTRAHAFEGCFGGQVDAYLAFVVGLVMVEDGVDGVDGVCVGKGRD